MSEQKRVREESDAPPGPHEVGGIREVEEVVPGLGVGVADVVSRTTTTITITSTALAASMPATVTIKGDAHVLPLRTTPNAASGATMHTGISVTMASTAATALSRQPAGDAVGVGIVHAVGGTAGAHFVLALGVVAMPNTDTTSTTTRIDVPLTRVRPVGGLRSMDEGATERMIIGW